MIRGGTTVSLFVKSCMNSSESFASHLRLACMVSVGSLYAKGIAHHASSTCHVGKS